MQISGTFFRAKKFTRAIGLFIALQNPFSPSHLSTPDNPPLVPFTGESSWIWSAEGSHAVPPDDARSLSHYQVRRFRLSFEIEDGAEASAHVHVSADSRFLFYCNGELVGRGPAKGDIDHHFFDSFELKPYLRTGTNHLAALVFDMSRVAHRPSELGPPCSVMTYTGGFLLSGHLRMGGEEIALHTGEADWSVSVDREYRFQNDDTRFEGYHGYFEDRVEDAQARGWLVGQDSLLDWSAARSLYLAERLENRRDPTSPYGLVARIIPQLTEGELEKFTAAFQPGGDDVDASWRAVIAGEGSVEIPAHSEQEVILDTGALTSGYPVLALHAGDGVEVKVTYAEALRLPWDTPGAVMLGEKQPLENLAAHFADEDTGWTFDRRGTMFGWSDRWRPAAGETTFEPWHWRAFRFVGLRVKTGDQPVTLQRVGFRESAYPYHPRATFTCSDPAVGRIWHAGVRTMQLCSHETFEDCPHYEQMQYAGDTMITSHLGMLTTGEYRLSRQALLHFDWSRGPDGLTHSRYPSRLRQVIPSWSLHWITAVRDYGLCSGELDTVAEVRPGMLAVLDWFRRHRDERGLPAKLPYWNITDWCPWWPRGVVPGADTGSTCIISAQWIQALDEVAQVDRWLGHHDEADALEAEAAASRKILHDTFWSEELGLYRDRPDGDEISQYGNAWAVACGAADEATCARLQERFPRDPKLAPGSFFAWHAIWRAMRTMGTYDEMMGDLGPWHESINLGLDTFVEENSYWRSLCHAWSAHPVLEFLTQVLGVQPTAPGFASLRVRPRLVGLQHASGQVCTPRGMVKVSWQRKDGQFALEVSSPAETPIEIVMPDGSVYQGMGGAWQGEGKDSA